MEWKSAEKRVDLDVCGRKVNFKTDSWADVNVISKNTWPALGRPALHSAPTVMLLRLGERCMSAVYSKPNDHGDGHSLLSKTTASMMGSVKRVNEVAFGAVKCPPVKIKLREGATPYSVNTTR